MRVSDNGTELTGMAMLRWSQEMLIECATSRPASCSKTLLSRVSMAGSGTDSSMRRYSHHSHRSAILAAWKNDYNTVRPHSALANFTPIEYADRCTPNRNGADRCATPGERGRPAPLLHRAHSLEAFQLAIANSDLAGTCNLLRRRNDLRRHSSALANCQPEQLLVNTLKFSLYRAALQPIVVAAQQKMDRDDNAVHYLLGWSLFRLLLRFPGVNSSYFGSSCRGQRSAR